MGNIKMVVVKTEDLLALLGPESVIEASISAGGFRCCHFLTMADGLVYDEGIDGEESERSPEEFLALYPGVSWLIEQTTAACDDVAW